MSNINIKNAVVENVVSQIVNKVQTEIIDASAASRDIIINSLENSSGDFIESFKEEIAYEVAVINTVGDFLIAMANYVQSAAVAFERVDAEYVSSKFE